MWLEGERRFRGASLWHAIAMQTPLRSSSPSMAGANHFTTGLFPLDTVLSGPGRQPGGSAQGYVSPVSR